MTNMCDPLSATGSILAVITIAAQSCESLSQLFRSFREAAEDLEHYISTLEALKIIKKQAPDRCIATKGFGDRLEECRAHLQTVEHIVRPWYSKLKSSRVEKIWTIMKWSTGFQRQKVERFMAKIESHYRVFTLDLLMVNTYVVSSQVLDKFV